jgi:hypothetical protein
VPARRAFLCAFSPIAERLGGHASNPMLSTVAPAVYVLAFVSGNASAFSNMNDQQMQIV